MTLAAFFIFAFEVRNIHMLFRKYFGDYALPATIEEFLREASFEDILKLQGHQINMYCALCLATMGRLFNA